MPYARKEAVAGRKAIADFAGETWDQLVAFVENLPRRYVKDGRDLTTAFARTHLRTFVDKLALSAPPTQENAVARHRIHALIEPWFLHVMVEDTNAGRVLRIGFLEAVEREMFAPSVRAIFASGRESDSESYVPDVGET